MNIQELYDHLDVSWAKNAVYWIYTATSDPIFNFDWSIKSICLFTAIKHSINENGLNQLWVKESSLKRII